VIVYLKNKYRIENNVVFMTLKNKKGLILETCFDADDLEKIIKLDLSWHLKWDNKTQSYYVKATESYIDTATNKRKQRTIHLHRIIVGVVNNLLYVDHINHDTLDNKKANLRITNKRENMCNRPKPNTNNSSGYRNVTYEKQTKKWIVQLQIDGKNTKLGSFEDVHDAGRYAKEKRSEIYGEYAGN
jgi:hypothetical protein